MPRRCTACTHPELEDINYALVAGDASLRTIADRWSVSKTALIRHKEEHIPSHLAKAEGAREIARADGLLDQVRDLRDKALSILTQAERAGELRTALQGVREARGCLELMAKLEGELKDGQTVNILVAPEWLTLRSAILGALESYPEARQVLVEVLNEHPSN